MYFKLDTLSICYNHAMIHKWVSTNFLQGAPNRVRAPAILSNDIGWFEKLMMRCVINGCAELWHVSALIRLSDDHSDASVGFEHTKLILDQLFENRGYGYESFVPRIFLAKRHWTLEVLVESLWCYLSSHEPDMATLKSQHPWGTPVYLGVALLKLGSQGGKETKIESMLDSLQCEWSPRLNKFILLLLHCAKQYDTSVKVATRPPKKRSEIKFVLDVSLTNFNVFCITDNRLHVVLRFNSIKFNKNHHKVIVKINGFKINTINADKNHYTCVKAEDMKHFCGSVQIARFEMTGNETKIQLLDEVVFYWSTNLHLKILTLIEEVKVFWSRARTILQKNDRVDSPKRTRKNIIVQLSRNALHIRISDRNKLCVSVNDMLVTRINDELNVQLITATVSVNDSDVFTFEGVQLNRINDHQEIKEERYNSEDFLLEWNKTWALNVDLFKAVFPYEHVCAEAIQNEFVSVFKWLKIVHKRTKEPFTADSPLPSDLLINVKEFLFEMSDDPFEVRLRDNYELLEDEYKESLKRQKMLDAKVSELCKNRLHLPARKVEELYANLNKKNAEIYVQRSKQMYRVPARTRLFAWCMSDVKIMALADPSIHGTENVVRIIREIDPDSPWPEEGLKFTTLWCRSVSMSCKEWKYQLRDFPQPLLDITELHLFGCLVGAEQEAPRRAKRDVVIDLGAPWGEVTIERGMTPLKFYHDFNCEVQHFSYAFGPCWEPVIAQCNLSFEKISSPSRDPSPPLSFWDKMRLLFHGRLTMCINQMTLLLHASLDPYNTTEEMELTWTDVAMDWTNAKFVYKGDLNVYVRTASKYDDCQLLHLPNLKLTIKIDWVCLADPNDHHSVVPCAPDKLPEYSSNQVHDSFRAFRSQNVHISIALETKSLSTSPNDFPTLLLYGSTLRWIENLKLILSGVTRPTKRGTIFRNVRPKKIQLSRHYKKVHLLLGLHKFQICYWMSFAMQRGFELIGGRLSSSSEHTLSLVPIDDGLTHRPRAEWSIMYMNCDLTDAEIWLQSALQENAEDESEKEVMSSRQPVEKCYCLSVGKVSYGRETAVYREPERVINKDTPTHRLVVYDLKGAWTKSNRNVAVALFDSFIKTQQLKKNLSTEALKGFRCETNSTPLKSRRIVDPSAASSPSTIVASTTVQAAPSPMSKIQSGHAVTMLQQLIAEAENKAVVFSDDLSSAPRQQNLKGLQACQEDDVQHKNWLIALVNSQVLLKGCETKGYVILSAAKAEILQRIHRPVWKDHTLVSKTTWVGTLESMQYYATVSAGENDSLDENIMWLTVDNIQEKDSTVIADLPDVPDLVGSGQSVGGVVSETVGASSIGENPPIQLQRIVSRCKCEFFYVGYGDGSIDLEQVAEVPPPPQEDVGPWDRPETTVDGFTLMHHDLDVCTNSLQYAMLLDIVNNLLLFVEPHRKKTQERLALMRFQLQLHSPEDQKRPIQNLQNKVRGLASKIRRLEKEMYLVSKAFAENPNDYVLLEEIKRLESSVYESKEHLTNQSEELHIMLSCYKEMQLSAMNRLSMTQNDKPLTTVRANEICFKHAQWRLTEADGQLGIADLVLSNFVYTKNSRSDDSVEHLLELGYIRMTNLLPNQVYTEVLCPTEIQSNMPVEHKRVLRVFCRERPPVGGISVKEHFEINVVPITIGLTKKFFNTMLKFCFPERDPDNIEGDTGDEIDENSRGKKTRTSVKKKDTNFYVSMPPKDDVEKMKVR